MQKHKLQLLDDLPVNESNQFQFDKYSETLATAIVLTKTPITFGIFGDWGTGKTSLMKMIKRTIDRDHPKVLSIWFDAWRYENEPNIAVPLIYTIRDEIISAKHTVSDEFMSFLGKFILALSTGLETSITSGTITLKYKADEAIKALREFEDRKSFGKAVYYDMFRYLEEEIDKWGIKFVIFVDDLDRCSPEKAMTTLETIQLIFNMEGIVFVVGASNNALEKAISLKYANLGFDGRSFMKKIFPVSFAIPPLQKMQIGSYIDKLLMDVKSSPEELDILPNYFSHGAENNPREIKRLINTYIMMRKVFDEESQSFDVSKLALFAVLQQEWPRIFRDISTHEKEFIQFCKWFAGQKDTSKISTPAWARKDLSIENDFVKFLRLSGVKLDFKIEDITIYVHALTTAALHSLLPAQIRFKSTNEKIKKVNRWSIWPDVTSHILNRIEKIEYTLPTARYAQHKRETGPEEGFRLEEENRYDEPVEIEILVRFKEFSQPEQYIYTVNLS